MSPGELAKLIEAGESERVELKASTSQRRRAAETVCAMLNGAGGHVVFGVDPGGTITGLTVADKTLRDVTEELREISPPAYPAVATVDLSGERRAIVITVERGTAYPYSHRGTAYRRVGSSTVEMSREEFERLVLERHHGTARWEIELAEGATIAELDGDEVRRTVDEAIRRGRAPATESRDVADLLRGLGLTRDGQVTNAALALFGRPSALQERLPQALLRLARFRGIERLEFLDNRQIVGNIFELLRAADQFLLTHVPIASRISPNLFERVDEPLYPPVATREALANAFCHREYSDASGSVGVALFDDRLEVSSPGTLHFGLTPASLFEPHESRPWNPRIADVLFKRGVVERWGTGIARMTEAVEQVGLPRPEIAEIPGAVVVRIRQARYTPPLRVGHDLSARQQAILDALGSGEALLVSAIAARLPEGRSASRRRLAEDLNLLRHLGLVGLQGHGRGARWSLGRRNPPDE